MVPDDDPEARIVRLGSEQRGLRRYTEDEIEAVVQRRLEEQRRLLIIDALRRDIDINGQRIAHFDDKFNELAKKITTAIEAANTLYIITRGLGDPELQAFPDCVRAFLREGIALQENDKKLRRWAVWATIAQGVFAMLTFGVAYLLFHHP